MNAITALAAAALLAGGAYASFHAALAARRWLARRLSFDCDALERCCGRVGDPSAAASCPADCWCHHGPDRGAGSSHDLPTVPVESATA